MADYNNITVDEAYQLLIVQTFNDLSYLKAKRKFDEFILSNK